MTVETRSTKNRQSERLRRRKETWFGKGHELGRDYDVDIFQLMHKKGQLYTYRSTDKSWWPPTWLEIVSKIHSHYEN
jgi:hypothetical protein